MVKSKRTSEPTEPAKKKRKSKNGDEEEASERRKSAAPAEQPLKSNSSSNTQTTTTTTTTPSLPYNGDVVSMLKERFNALHQIRYTEPEKQCNDLLKLVEQQKTANESLVKNLETRIAHLEHNSKELAEVKTREKALLQEAADMRTEIESLKRSLELADQERTALVKAIESAGDTEKDTRATVQQMVTILDNFKTVTGVTLTLEENSFSEGSCTIFNPVAKLGVRLGFVTTHDGFIFTPTANKNLLPLAIRNGPTKVSKNEASSFIARILHVLFSSS